MGIPLAFTVASEVQQISWFINSELQTGYSGQTSIEFSPATTGSYEISVQVRDISGKIKKDDQLDAEFDKSWQVTVY